MTPAPGTALRVLVLEDRRDDAELMLLALEECGYEVFGTRVDDRAAFEATLTADLDVILADWSLPGFDAMAALRLVQERGLSVPVVIVSGTISEDTAVECLHAGAADYLVKDRMARLPKAVQSAIERRRLRDDRAATVQRLQETADELARVNAALIEADRAKDRLLTMTAHELRTPLTSMLGFSSLLIETWEQAPDEQGLRWCEIIHRQTRRIIDRMDDLLTMANLESGEFAGAPARHVVRDLIDQVLRDLAVEEFVQVDCPVDLTVRVDRASLERILATFVSNAFKYGFEPVVVEAALVGDEVVIRVVDHGPGIEESFVPRMFDKYAKPIEHDPAGGLGLGLALARRLAEAAGGRVWFEPNRPQGAQLAVAVRRTD